MPHPAAVFKLYYLITPLFFILDSAWGLSFRVAGLTDPLHRYFYYSFCLLCGLLCYYRPVLSNLVTMAESSINFFILIMGVMLPLITLGNLEEQEMVSAGLSGQRLVNFLMTGSMLLYNFYTAQYGMVKKID